MSGSIDDQLQEAFLLRWICSGIKENEHGPGAGRVELGMLNILRVPSNKFGDYPITEHALIRILAKRNVTEEYSHAKIA